MDILAPPVKPRKKRKHKSRSLMSEQARKTHNKGNHRRRARKRRAIEVAV